MDYTEVIDSAWLLKLAKGEVMPERGGRVPPWQLLPQEAKLPLSKLQKTTQLFLLPIAVLSYGWAARDHPDPTGKLLQRLVPVLEAMAHSCKHGERRPAAWGIVWDFLSLPQRVHTGSLTPHEQERFDLGLKNINVWYRHAHTTVLVCDWPMPEGAENPAPIGKRGWCFFERCLSSAVKIGTACLQLQHLPEQWAKEEPNWPELVQACTADRHAPLAPDAYESMLREGDFRFTNGKDATEVCIPQYREGFLELFERRQALGFVSCKWADAEVRQLCAAFRYAHAQGRACQATWLMLENNRLTAESVRCLVPLLDGVHLPELDRLDLWNNEGLSDEGARLLAAELRRGRPPKLKRLLLKSTGMGDAGAAALSEALRAGAPPPTLEFLAVGGNLFGREAREELKAACEARGILALGEPLHKPSSLDKAEGVYVQGCWFSRL